jgi:universal stress protein A
MPALFTKILCPIDFTENSLAALDLARQLAEQNQATICLLHVIFLPVVEPGKIPPEPYPTKLEAPARAKLEEIAAEQLKGRAAYEILVRAGDPASLIVDVEKELNVDLIVMATHGRTGLTRFFLGSVADRVVHESTRPVLTVRVGARQS